MGQLLLRRAANPIIVLDKLDNPSVLGNIVSSVRARILVTTNRMLQEWSAYQVIRLERMSSHDAVELVYGVSPHIQGTRVDVARLVEDLGHEPLAVRRAAEYLDLTGIGVADLRQWLVEDPVGACVAISGKVPGGGIVEMFEARFESADETRFAMDVLRVIAVVGDPARTSTSAIAQLSFGHQRDSEIEAALTTLQRHRLIELLPEAEKGWHVKLSLLVRSLVLTTSAHSHQRAPLALQRARRKAWPLLSPESES
jgi:hypothetical protein